MTRSLENTAWSVAQHCMCTDSLSLWFSLPCLMAQDDCYSSRHHIHIQDKKKGEGGNSVKNRKASHKSLQKTSAFTS